MCVAVTAACAGVEPERRFDKLGPLVEPSTAHENAPYKGLSWADFATPASTGLRRTPLAVSIVSESPHIRTRRSVAARQMRCRLPAAGRHLRAEPNKRTPQGASGYEIRHRKHARRV
jgi:hypothetical protein